MSLLACTGSTIAKGDRVAGPMRSTEVSIIQLCYCHGLWACYWTKWMSEARFPFKCNRLRCVNENRKKRKRLRWQGANNGCHCFDRAFLLAGACVCWHLRARNKRKRQPIGMLGRSSGNHDWLLANASDCVWMETGLECSLHYSTTRT